MQPTSTNGVQHSTHAMLDGLRQAIEKLEAEMAMRTAENVRLRKERDEYRKLLVEHYIHQFGGAEAWDDFDEKDYTLTRDDLIAVIDAKQGGSPNVAG